MANSPTAASAEPAPDDEPLRVLPFLQFQKTPDHQGEFLRKLLDRAVGDAYSPDVAMGQNVVEPFSSQLLAGMLAKRVGSKLAQFLTASFR
jgi:hypothetical protein